MQEMPPRIRFRGNMKAETCGGPHGDFLFRTFGEFTLPLEKFFRRFLFIGNLRWKTVREKRQSHFGG